MNKSNRWYKTRKPRLQIEILGLLVLRGKLTKGAAESLLKRRHGDILDAFDKLEEKEFITKCGSKFGRGNKQYYYNISEKGLTLLITIEPLHPLKFWKVLLGYCHHNDKGLTFENAERLYQIFMEKYLKYKNHSFSFQMDIFDNMRVEWFSKKIICADKPNLDQKVIEVLSLSRGITIDELVEKTGETETDISKCLSSLTLDSYRPFEDKTVYIHQNAIGKKHSRKYWDFLVHNLVISRQNNENGIKTFELSLFGVMLALALVRYNDMDKLKQGLHHANIVFSDYYDKIASNYHDKLPLIFGKWQLLKRILKRYSAYNFDIIIDQSVRSSDSSSISLIRGGNRELTNSIREVVLQTRQQFGDFANAGEVNWLNYISGMQYEHISSKNQAEEYLMINNVCYEGKPNFRKVAPLKRKLNEIQILLNPIEHGFHSSRSDALEPEFKSEISYQLEKLFADEITALYYFHLYYDYEFNGLISQQSEYYSPDRSTNKFPISYQPKECLLSILQKDQEKPLVIEWFYRWMQDIRDLQKDVYDLLDCQTNKLYVTANP